MNILRHILLLVVTLIFSTGLMAQTHTIKGKVIDFTTEEPLPGAHITLPGTTIGKATDANGNFVIENIASGNFRLMASYSGYGTFVIPVSVPLNGDLMIKLKQVEFDIDQVVVTGTRSPKPLKETPVLTQVISSSQIASSDLYSIEQALEQTVSGIDFEHTSSGPSVTMMGLPSNYILFLRDGNRIAGEVNGNIDYNRISTQNVNRIEIVRGASSVLYGSNAMAGVINIISKPQIEPVSLDFFTRYSDFNTFQSEGMLGLKQNNITSQTSYKFTTTDGYDLNDDPEDGRTKEKSSTNQLAQQYNWRPTQFFEIEARGSVFRNYTDASLPDRKDLMNDNLDFYTKAIWYVNTQSKIEAVWHEDHYKIYEKEELDRSLEYDNRYKNGRIVSNAKFFDHSLTTIGAEYLEETMIAPRNNISGKSYNDWIAFIQEDAQINQNISLTGGVRLNYNSDYGSHYTWQFSAMTKFNELTIRGNLGRGFKTPTLKERYMEYRVPIGFPIFIYGNDELLPETSFYRSVSAELTLTKVNVTFNAYRNTVNDMISEELQSSGPGGLEYKYQNFDEVEIEGVDLLVHIHPLPVLKINGGFNYNYAKDQKQDRQMSGNRLYSARINLTYSPDLPLTPDFTLNGTYMGEMIRRIHNRMTGVETTYKLDGYTIWKFIVNVKPAKGLVISGGVDNIFNFTDKETFATFSPGLTTFVSLRASF
jgi:outer membrane receptor for ferrienterochelin and colicins